MTDFPARYFFSSPVCLFKNFLWLVLLSLPMLSRAQYTGYKPIADYAQFKTQFAAEAGKIQTIKSNFVQEKSLAMLSEKINSEGKFYFKRSNHVRIEYEKPFQYLMVMNGEKIMVKDDQKESTMNVKSNKIFQQVNNIMIDCVQGSILDNKDFKVRVFENDKSWLMEMTPADAALKEFFSTIVIFVDRKDYSATSIEMNEASGDKTVIRFSQKELNVPIADEVFAIH
jgi:outer membrane lipoprotein-sorting protein